MAPQDIDPPRRRSDDYVTFRDMVEYVSETEAKMHSIRAESLININNQMEHLEATVTKAVDTISERFERHELWHRDVLQGFLDRAVQNKLSTGALVASIISIVVSTAIAIFALLSAHP